MKTYKTFTYNSNQDPQASIQGFLERTSQEGYEFKAISQTQNGYAYTVIVIVEKTVTDDNKNSHRR